MSSVVPEGWSRQKLGDSLIPRPKSKLPSGESNPLGYYDFYVCSHKVLKSFHNEYSSPSILFSTGGEASVHLASERYAFSTDVWATEFEGNICNEYVFRLLEENIRTINYSGFQGSGIKHLDKSFIEKLEFSIPPLPEQKKIASILTSVDEVIENTQKQIDKLQDLKKATMNELLTKGIGHTEFKDSELGRIPKSWEIRFLDDVTKRGSGHTPAKQNPSYWNGGIKWVSLADSSRLDKGFIYETDKEISEDGLANSSAVLHPKGTVVLSRDAGVGKSSVLAEEMAVSQHFMAWRCENLTDSWFLYYWMQKAKPIFEAVAIGSTIKTIGLGYFKQLKMAYPPFEEQKSIATKLLSIDEHIDKLKGKLSQTQSLKKSLMQDLLTGKVRVTVN
jgi:type I restriction enzyme S subunit